MLLLISTFKYQSFPAFINDSVSPFAFISVATSPLRITLLPCATSIGIDRFGSVPSRTNFELHLGVHINDALSIFMFTVYLTALSTQSQTNTLSMTLSPVWTCGLDGPAVSPDCPPKNVYEIRRRVNNHV